MVGKESSGRCELCGQAFAKTEMTKHLGKCDKWTAGPTETFHLAIGQTGSPRYWLHLEAAAATTLEDLDGFLRDVWLDCCGHMSSFTIGRTSYSSLRDVDQEVHDKPMHMAVLGKVLKPGAAFEHEYDFGTPTKLALKVAGRRQTKLRAKESVRLLARNDPPSYTCVDCEKAPATDICSSCSWKSGGTVCERCRNEHACGKAMLLPLVNSPRTGVCGYTGPEIQRR